MINILVLKRFCSAFVLAVLALSPALGQSTVFVVRHAEKGDDVSGKDDPYLSKTGNERAQSLANVLQHTNISVIYVSEKKRTLETAQPLADKLKITAVPIPRKDTVSIVEK